MSRNSTRVAGSVASHANPARLRGEDLGSRYVHSIRCFCLLDAKHISSLRLVAKIRRHYLKSHRTHLHLIHIDIVDSIA